MNQHTSPRVAVIGGGANDEHEVSLASAAAVVRAVRALGLDVVPMTIGRDGTWHHGGGAVSAAAAVALLTTCDVAFPVLHGVNGEDGSAAGLLGMTGLPYVGSSVRAGALGIDKWVTKLVASALGIPTAPGALVRDRSESAAVTLPPPYVVKPTTGGSSNGVSVVRDRGDLAAAIGRARSLGDAVLVEQYVSGREVDIALFRDRDGRLRAGATLEIGVAAGGVFGREEKYDGTASFTVPAPVSANEERMIARAAAALYEALGCGGVARFDFFLTAAGIVLNEVNTAPGLTEQSQVPRMYAATGLGYVELIRELLETVVGAPIGAEVRR